MPPSKDVHAEAPARGRLQLRSVGVSGIRKPLNVQRGGRTHALTVTFHVAVDLPSDRKGSDLSRNAEILAEIVDETVTRPVESLENACASIAAELLRRHPYATEASVDASAEYFLRQGITEAKRSFEDYTLLAEARAGRDARGKVALHRAVGAEAVGMTACPCAMESSRELLQGEYPDARAPSLRQMPVITHNQRNRTTLTIDLPDGVEIEADRIIEAIEAAQSAPTYSILKRGDEAQVVLDAHRRPRFVEDVVRELLASVPTRFPELTGATAVEVRSVSEESIHKYDVVASHRATLAELRPGGAG